MKRGPIWLLSCACTFVIGTAGVGGAYALGKHAEALFLRQQDAQSALVNTLTEVEAEKPALANQLYGLEDDLHAACSSLREAGQRRLEGEDLGSDLEWAIVTSLKKCGSATNTVERRVQQAEAGAPDQNPPETTPPAELGDR